MFSCNDITEPLPCLTSVVYCSVFGLCVAYCIGLHSSIHSVSVFPSSRNVWDPCVQYLMSFLIQFVSLHCLQKVHFDNGIGCMADDSVNTSKMIIFYNKLLQKMWVVMSELFLQI